MPTRRVGRFGIALVLGVAAPGRGLGQAGPPSDTAEIRFVAGEFEAAGGGFAGRWASDSTDYRAALRLGMIALYANRLSDADRWLGRAMALAPDSMQPKTLLAEALSRRDDFGRAARLLRDARRTLRASKLESFTGVAPNELRADRDETRLPFVMTDPLPMVWGRVNGSDTLFFLIDTGGGELILDSVVARTVGAVEFGRGQGVFAGGVAPVADGRVDSVRLGDLTIHHVPVRIMNVRQTAAAVGGHRVDGIIGTVVLYHFLATIDYPGGQLVLRRRTPAVRERFEREAVARRAIALPFWLAGDHFMFAWGRVNGRPPVLLFVDTGLAGGGFVCSDSAARSYGIDLSRATTSEGVGGAGKTQVTWFSVDSLSLGPATGRNIRGAVGALRFRESFGFDAGGIISHQFFRPFALTFDFDGMRLWLEPGPE